MKIRKISQLGWLGLLLAFGSAMFLVSAARGAMSSLAAVEGAGRGIHLGNVSGGEKWDEAYFSMIREDGAWPDVVVFMSDQVYKYDRVGDQCGPIETVYVPDTPSHQAVWRYLLEAVEHGSKIVIRIYPSPGYVKKGELVPDPVGEENFCGLGDQRSVDHVADEICAIYEQGGLGSQVSFLPANEPNLEWYYDKKDHPDPPDA